jgi:hypothetical protein
MNEENILIIGDDLSAAALIQQHGQTILRLAENHLAGLQNKFDAFKSEKQELLKELGLV